MGAAIAARCHGALAGSGEQANTHGGQADRCGRGSLCISPIDLIPDFIPVLGLLDDIILLPLGIAIAIRLVPPELMARFRRIAARRQGRPRSRAGAVIVILLWIGAVAAAALLYRAA